MFQYIPRILPAAIRAKLGADGRIISRLNRRVKIREIDLNRHMNQAVYAEVFELGRLDWVLRSRAWPRWRSQGVHPVVAEQRIVYRRELKPLQRYTTDTRAVHLDGRLLCFEQYLWVGDRVHALGECKLIFIGGAGVLSADEVAEQIDGLLSPGLCVDEWRVVG